MTTRGLGRRQPTYEQVHCQPEPAEAATDVPVHILAPETPDGIYYDYVPDIAVEEQDDEAELKRLVDNAALAWIDTDDTEETDQKERSLMPLPANPDAIIRDFT